VDIDRFTSSPVGHLVPISGYDPRFGEDYEHWAYIPDPLPVELGLSQETWRAIADAMLAIGRLDQASYQVPDTSILRRPTLRREAQSTSALEGTIAPLEDVLEIDPGDPDADQSPELAEVLNYVRTAEYAYDWVGVQRPITLALLLELHQLLIAGTQADGPETGRVRSQQVVIAPPGTHIRDARFVPPPGGEQLEVMLRDWVAWIESPSSMRSPLLAAALAHYQFETLHPFHDGNGRLGRLVIVLQLLRGGLLRDPLFTVSPWFEARRREYQDQLMRVSEEGGWDSWVSFFVEGIRAQAASSAAKVADLLAYRDQTRALARQHGLKGVAIDIIEDLIARPVITISSVAARYQPRTPQAVGNAVRRLADLGVLTEITGRQYGRVFASTPVVQILQS